MSGVWRTIHMAVVGLLGLAACDCGDGAVAELIRTSGDVQRDTRASQQVWTVAAIGESFGIGDGLWLRGPGESAVRLRGGQQLEMQPNTIIRFGSVEAELGEFEVVSGEAVLSVGQTPYSLKTQFGIARIDGRSRVLVRHNSGRQQLEVQLGKARFQTNKGEEFIASVGDAVIMSADGVSLGQPMESVAGVRLPSGAPPDGVVDGLDRPNGQDGQTGIFEVRVKGDGAAAQAKGSGTFVPLAGGSHQLRLGAVLRLSATTSAVISRGDEVVEAMGAGEFRLGGAEATEIAADTGALHVQTGGRRVTIQVPGGVIVVEAPEGGSDAKLAIGQRDTRVVVSRGVATIVGGGASGREVSPGESGILVNQAASPPPSLQPGAEGPTHADLRAAGGQSFSVHVPTVPVVVGLSVGGMCPGAAIVKVGRKLVRGRGHVNVPLKAGRHSYGLHCIVEGAMVKKRVARGVITVLRDAGTRRLPKAAPATTVDADGRRYTVIYQNQPPYITVRWPDAPQAARYELRVKSKGKVRTHRLDAPSFRFPSGRLRDGVHDLQFSTQGGRKGKATTLELRFDHVAPKASVRSPQDRSFAPGAAVDVAGVVLRGWKVSVEGGTIEMDRQWRFSGVVKTTTTSPNVVLQLSHPRQGVHYYLRRAASR